MSKKLWILSGIVALLVVGAMGWFFRPTFSSLLTSNIQLKMGWSGPENSGHGQAIKAYQQELKKREASVELSLFSGDRLGEKTSVLEQIRLGQPYLGFMTMNDGAKYSKKTQVLSLPVLFKNSAELGAFMESEAAEVVKEELNAKGFQVLGWISMPVDSLWIRGGKVFPVDLKQLNVGLQGLGYDEVLWRNYEVNVRSLPQGLWQSETFSGTIQGLVASSEWMSQSGLFWKFPKRISVGGVKPAFLVMNRELFLSLPENVQKGLMEATAVWSDWDSERVEEINFNQIAGQTNIVTTVVSEGEYSGLTNRAAQGLDKEQKDYLEAIRKALGGKFFFESIPAKKEEEPKKEGTSSDPKAGESSNPQSQGAAKPIAGGTEVKKQ